MALGCWFINMYTEFSVGECESVFPFLAESQRISVTAN